MAGRGRAPQEIRSRERDAKRQAAEIEKISADGSLRGSPLPKDHEWHPRTRAWWASWRRSAIAQNLTENDWDFLLDTARLHTEMWNGGPATLAAEIRLRVGAFGGTPEARMRLKMKVTDEEGEIAQTVNMDDARRNRLKVISE